MTREEFIELIKNYSYDEKTKLELRNKKLKKLKHKLKHKLNDQK